MRNFLLIILFLFLYIHNSQSQDIIVNKDGTTIKVKVEEIGVNEIKYHKHENLEGPIYVIMKKDVVVVYFEDGTTEIINANTNEKLVSLEETKNIIIEHIDNYTYIANSNKKRYKVSFEGDYIRMSELNRSGEKPLQSDLFDFSRVYKFGNIDKRKNDIAFLNIWVSILKNERKDKWDKYKLVIKVQGYSNAELINNALKHHKKLMSCCFLANRKHKDY